MKKILILGASGFLGGILYEKIKKETDFWVLGTYHESKKSNDFIKLNVTNLIEVKTFLQHFKADVIIWCLMAKTNEEELINQGLPNVLNNMDQACKFVFMSSNSVFSEGEGNFSEQYIPCYKSKDSALALYSNAKINGEKLVSEIDNHIIIRSGTIYGQYISGKWDKRVALLIEELTARRTVVRTINLINTFVDVNELAASIIKIIRIGYKGIIHLGPTRKESYYDYFKKMAIKLNLDETLILSNYIDEGQAIESGRILDMSLSTRKCKEELGLIFSDLE